MYDSSTALAFRPHDHRDCRRSALAAVRAACADRGLRLTPARARVLEILLEAHRALGAYDILGRLGTEGKPAQPPVAYRALEFLVAHGFAHRIERLNAFIACNRPDAPHDASFMICRGCGSVAESSRRAEAGALGAIARDIGFAIERTVIEAEGLCPECRAAR